MRNLNIHNIIREIYYCIGFDEKALSRGKNIVKVEMNIQNSRKQHILMHNKNSNVFENREALNTILFSFLFQFQSFDFIGSDNNYI